MEGACDFVNEAIEEQNRHRDRRPGMARAIRFLLLSPTAPRAPRTVSQSSVEAVAVSTSFKSCSRQCRLSEAKRDNIQTAESDLDLGLDRYRLQEIFRDVKADGIHS